MSAEALAQAENEDEHWVAAPPRCASVVNPLIHAARREC